MKVTEFSDLPEGFATVRISAQRYAIFRHPAHVSMLRRTHYTIWNKWLPASDVKMVIRACISCVVEEHRSGHPVDQKDITRRAAMRIFPIAIALGLTVAGPALAASELAKMKGQDQNATEPARHRAQSAKMHKQHQTQNPSSQSGSGTVSTESSTQK